MSDDPTHLPRAALLFVGGMDDARVDGALGRLGLTVDKPFAPELFTPARRTVAVIDPAALGLDSVAELRAAIGPLGDTPVVVLSGPCSRAALADLIALPTVAAIVARDHHHSDAELGAALDATVCGPRFGLSRHGTPGAARLEEALGSSHEREAVLDRIAAFLAERGVRRRLAAAVIDGAEELITNALYDAPTDDDGRRIYAEIDRRHAVFLGADARPRIGVAVDAHEVVVAVEDPHGSLEVGVVRRFLAKGLRAGPDQIDDKLGGAGLGFARVYAMSDRMAVHVERGARSEVSFALALGGARRDMAARPSGLVLAETSRRGPGRAPR